MLVVKRNGRKKEDLDINKILLCVEKAYRAKGKDCNNTVKSRISRYFKGIEGDLIAVEEIQDRVEQLLMKEDPEVAKAYILYRKEKENIRLQVKKKMDFIKKYKKSTNTANATIDDNSNVAGKNVGILNAEIHKEENIHVSRGMIVEKLKSLYPNFDAKQYLRDLENHIIYKHDESTFAGAIAPYCCSVSMYPFLLNGIKELGGLSAAPKNIDSYCGMYTNLVFALSGQFAGAIATSEFLVYFDYFARKEWGNEYYKDVDSQVVRISSLKHKTIKEQIHQYFQQVIYTINQPVGARGMQAAFVNFSIFDKSFFDGMFGEFYFPDGTQPKWESLQWLQEDFMQWFNNERLRCILTFPVVSVAMICKDGVFTDQRMFQFVCEEYARGDSFFTYISDTADSLASCCRLKNKVQTKEFNFTNGNMGIQTGSKSVITLNLNRIVQNCASYNAFYGKEWKDKKKEIKSFLSDILDRVYKYHTAYNELLLDVEALLPAYKAGFISLNKQYMTIGINGLNEAAEFLGMQCTDNQDYQEFCQLIFSHIKEENIKHKTNKITYNTECVPAESLAIKNYNWDKADGYQVPKDRNLYASYIYIPSEYITIQEKIRMHGSRFIGDYLDGGSAAHLNLDSHLSSAQYDFILKYAAKNGCQYLTFNVPNSECQDCGFITKHRISACPKCGSEHIDFYDRVIGYLTRIRNWSDGRQIEQKTRVYENVKLNQKENEN